MLNDNGKPLCLLKVGVMLLSAWTHRQYHHKFLKF